jgi:1-aminocyclopropane-1-carboxylate deaminase/D-cysteine desulfhydrase-like pyridoxal-dependent ACC family enzyme
MENKIYEPIEITPVEFRNGIYFKRDDLFKIGKSCGGKVRSCWYLAQKTKGLVTAGSRSSPQVNIVAEIANRLNIPAIVFTPEGELMPEVKLAVVHGATVYQVEAGYNLVIINRSRIAARKYGYKEIPFGMETIEAINQTRKQLKHIPNQIKRIVMPVGSGMSLAGVLWGLIDLKINIPVIGIVVGADPKERLDKYAPRNWRKRVQLIKSDSPYHEYYKKEEFTYFNDILLDPIYEAKCIPYIQKGDLFWIVGQRASMGIPTDYINERFNEVRDKRVFRLSKKDRKKRNW